MADPRLLNRDQAASYCGVSATTFEAHVAVQPVRIGSRVLWDKVALDAWLDEQSGLVNSKQPATPYDDRQRRRKR